MYGESYYYIKKECVIRMENEFIEFDEFIKEYENRYLGDLCLKEKLD